MFKLFPEFDRFFKICNDFSWHNRITLKKLSYQCPLFCIFCRIDAADLLLEVSRELSLALSTFFRLSFRTMCYECLKDFFQKE